MNYVKRSDHFRDYASCYAAIVSLMETSLLAESEIRKWSHRMSVAFGLALRRFGEK